MTPSEGKDPDSSDSRKDFHYSYVLICPVDPFVFFSFFIPSPTTAIVVVDFIGTMKSN